MKTKADTARLLWQLLVAAVIVYIAAGVILAFMDQADAFSGSAGGFATFVNSASGVAFRVGAGSLALLAGLALSSRSYDGR